jgi:hypothetical protein
MKTLLAVLLALLCGGASAAEVEGVKFPPAVQASGASLALNGAGLRKRAFFKVYAMGLYLAKKAGAAAEAIGAPGAKRVAIHMLRDVDAKTFTDALEQGMRDNHSEADMKALEPRVKQLAALMAELKEAKEGMAIQLDWVPGAGTALVADGTPRGKPIPGEDFYRALLRIWLGENPVSEDLKKALLGQPS